MPEKRKNKKTKKSAGTLDDIAWGLLVGHTVCWEAHVRLGENVACVGSDPLLQSFRALLLPTPSSVSLGTPWYRGGGGAVGSHVVAAPAIFILLICTALPKEQIAYLAGERRVRVARALLHQLRESAWQKNLSLLHKGPPLALLGAAAPSSSQTAI